jgi:hypothetical protein
MLSDKQFDVIVQLLPAAAVKLVIEQSEDKQVAVAEMKRLADAAMAYIEAVVALGGPADVNMAFVEAWTTIIVNLKEQKLWRHLS